MYISHLIYGCWRWSVASVAAGLVACGGSGGGAPEVRETMYGQVRGVDDSEASGTYYWKGVPFAKPPVGALRWHAPVAPEAWSGTLIKATKFGNACLQTGRMFGPGANNTYDASIGATLGQPVGNEDCLFVNIWRPATTEKKLPVLLFIHGGSNISGYTADPLYDGAALAKAANAVVATASYRLGILGFLNVPQLRNGGGEGGDSGNFALLDIMAALRFIQDNVANFGGDPGNVTLSGESAGAINLLAIMTSPMAKGLFHKAFEMSGGIMTEPNSLARGEAILEALLIADGTASDAAAAKAYIASREPAQIAEYLRAQDGGKMLSTVVATGNGSVGIIPDGAVIPIDPIGSITAGQYLKVPMLAGITHDEGKLFAAPAWVINDAERFSMMFHFDPDASTTLSVDDIIKPSYLPVDKSGTGYNAVAGLGTAVFKEGRDQLLNAMKTHQSNLWSYRFDWAQEASPWNDVYGAAHAFDLPFVFGNFGPSVISNVIGGKANEQGRLALSKVVMASVGAFMRKGDPSAPELGVNWAPWPSQLLFDATPIGSKITTQP